MNKLNVINELRRCVNPTAEGWDVWYRGEYLGSIVKVKAGNYAIIREDESNPFGERMSFMAAISSFLRMAMEVRHDQMLDIIRNSDVKLRSRGVSCSAQKTVWEKVKGWFK